MTKLIIQIPCLNEAETLHCVINDLPKEIPGIDCIETLVIDDGSRDGTSATALGLGVHHVVRHRRNRGLAAAFATGIDAALEFEADIIVNTDGDHQYPGEHIAALVKPILDGRADVVIGDRQPEQNRHQPWLKRQLYRLGRWTVSWILGEPIPDPVSGFRAYSRETAGKLCVVTRYSYTIETLVQSVEHGMAIEFVPITSSPPTRPSRLYRSHFQFVSRSAATLLRVFFMFHPLQTMLWLSTALATLGLLPIVRFLTFYALGQGDGHVQSLVLGVGALTLASLTLLAGIVADSVSFRRLLLVNTTRSPRSSSNSLQASPITKRR